MPSEAQPQLSPPARLSQADSLTRVSLRGRAGHWHRALDGCHGSGAVAGGWSGGWRAGRWSPSSGSTPSALPSSERTPTPPVKA
eukprot:16190-Rhodomonas_salina.1